MSTTQMDIIATREYEKNGEKKTAYTRIGTAFATKNGDGWQLLFDALPAHGKALMMPPKPRDDTARQSKPAPSNYGAPSYEDDDTIPF